MSQRQRDAHRDRDREAERQRRAEGTKEDWPTERELGSTRREEVGPATLGTVGGRKEALEPLGPVGSHPGCTAAWPWASAFICPSLRVLVCRTEVVTRAVCKESVTVTRGKTSVIPSARPDVRGTASPVAPAVRGGAGGGQGSQNRVAPAEPRCLGRGSLRVTDRKHPGSGCSRGRPGFLVLPSRELVLGYRVEDKHVLHFFLLTPE